MNCAVPSGDRRAPWSTCLWSSRAFVLVTIGILVCYGNAGAESFDRDIEFAARFVTGELYLHDGSVEIWNGVRRTGIEYAERYGGGVTIGLIGGYGTLSQNVGARLAGNYLGVVARGAVVSGGRADLSVGGRYLYQNLSGDTSTSPRTIDWQEWGVDTRFSYRVARQWILLLGGRYDWVVADQETKGLVSTTITLKAEQHTSQYVGLAFETDPGGFVAIALQRGLMAATEIVFRRVY
jgi:hypothetical protein